MSVYVPIYTNKEEVDEENEDEEEEEEILPILDVYIYSKRY